VSNKEVEKIYKEANQSHSFEIWDELMSLQDDPTTVGQYDDFIGAIRLAMCMNMENSILLDDIYEDVIGER